MASNKPCSACDENCLIHFFITHLLPKCQNVMKYPKNSIHPAFVWKVSTANSGEILTAITISKNTLIMLSKNVPINPGTKSKAILFLSMSFQFNTTKIAKREIKNNRESIPEQTLLIPTLKSPTPRIGLCALLTENVTSPTILENTKASILPTVELKKSHESWNQSMTL